MKKDRHSRLIKTRKARALRVRRGLRGTAEKPRLSVVKSNQHLQAQLIDDEKGETIAGLATYSKELRGTEHGKKGKAAAKVIGTRMAEMAKEKGVEKVVFDRGRHKYHGVLQAMAESAREGGLKF